MDQSAQNAKHDSHTAFAQYLVKYLNLSPGNHILDLACGAGLVSLAAAEAVGVKGSVVGIDVAEQLLGEAKQRVGNVGFRNIDFYSHSITDLESLQEIQGVQFDAIVCSSSLARVESPLQAIRSWNKYLKPGGVLSILVNHPRNFIAEAAIEVTSARLGVESPLSRLWVQDEQTLAQLLEACGLEIEDTCFNHQIEAENQKFDISDGDEQWHTLNTSGFTKALCEEAGEKKAKAYFLEDWKLFADKDGNIEEINGIYLAKARKNKNELKPLPLQGACACGHAKWEAAMLPISACQCCCKPCRKVSGSPFLMMMEIPSWAVIFTPSLRKMGKVSLMPQARRTFCPLCGSTWTFQAFRCMENIEIAMATLEEDKLQGIATQDVLSKAEKKWCWTSSKVGWWDIPDDGWPRDERMPSEKQDGGILTLPKSVKP